MKDKSKIVRYLISGGFSFFVEYGSFIAVVYILSAPAWAGQIISYILTLIVNFSLLRNWAFEENDKRSIKKHIIKYGLLVAFNLPMTTMLIYVLTLNNVPAFCAKIVVIVLATAWNFAIYDRIIFRKDI